MQVIRISPAGVVDKIVELPVKSPTSCTFGGQDLDTLYITTRGPDGGGLYAVTLPDGIRGQVEPEFNNFSVSDVRNRGNYLFCWHVEDTLRNTSAYLCSVVSPVRSLNRLSIQPSAPCPVPC